eukprot:TRINITY_DN102475_c0_g1_i1.p1 TRINITY_DN102475_c0_g1~~TRINITY_DN102475_c0_g1_i1.p1  ORF type:complete len:870 (+),score=127.50 TRINITY_DN102475_c0_g1_i1:217-2826(+)
MSHQLPLVKQHPRLPTPSLRSHYFQCIHSEKDAEQDAGDDRFPAGALPKSVSLPSLVQREVQVLTLDETGEGTEVLHAVHEAPAAQLLSHTRLGSSYTRRKALPSRDGRGIARVRSSTFRDPKAATKARSSLDKLATLAKNWEHSVKGSEMSLACALPHRRMRGLDVLYGAHRTSTLEPTPEEEESAEDPKELKKKLENKKKAEIMSSAPYFQTLETASPGLIQRLCNVTEFTTQVQGQVIFREGDRPGNCYVVVSGKVAVKILKDRPRSPGTTRRPACFPTMTPVKASKSMRRSWIGEVTDDRADWTELEHAQQKLDPRYQSLEGFSTWNPKSSELGTQVVALGPGAIFGELALQNDKTRSATIQCLEECKFLVVTRGGYRKILRQLTEENRAVFKAVDCLKKVTFFQQIEAQTAGIVNKLALGVTLEDIPAGQIIFRQQDPPGNCYVLQSGEVDVHIVPKEEVPSEGARVRSKHMMTPRACQDWNMGELITMVRAKDLHGGENAKKERETKKYRWLSFEGFSSYCEESRIGQLVTTLKEGACFGELALQSSKPRSATIRCKTDCSIYIISQAHFQKVLGEVLAKIHYFDNYLPGIKKMKYRQSHPSVHFQCANYPEGHKFLHEGIIANDAIVFLLKSGTVEFRRYVSSSENPAYVLSNTPLQESSWKSSCARPLTGVAGSRHNSTAPSSPNGRRQRSFDMGGQVTWDAMDDHGVWCSLAFFPLNSVEPFTVVAVTPVEVYWSAGSAALSMPPDLLLKLRTSLLRQMKERTKQLPHDVLGNPETLAAFNATTESFGGFAYSTFRSTFRTSFDSNLASTMQSRASLGSSLKSSAGNEEALLQRRPNGGEASARPPSAMRVTFSDLAMAC